MPHHTPLIATIVAGLVVAFAMGALAYRLRVSPVAGRLVIAIPGGFEAGGIAQIARELKPSIKMIARAHSDEEVAYLTRLGVKHVIMGEREIAAKMAILLTS